MTKGQTIAYLVSLVHTVPNSGIFALLRCDEVFRNAGSWSSLLFASIGVNFCQAVNASNI